MDPAALAARLHRTARAGTRSLGLVRDWLGRHRRAWVAWSGGKDSTTVAALANEVRPGIPVVHYDSGLDFPENTAYMTQVAAGLGWNFHPIRVGDGLREMVRSGAWDFSAPSGPDDYWWVLIAGPAAQAHERFGPAVLWGLRADESVARRWALVPRNGVRHRKDGTTTLAPIWWWTRRDTFAYLHRQGIPPNPIYARLAAVGCPEVAQRVDVVVGAAGADQGRLQWLQRGWPELWARYAAVLPRMRQGAPYGLAK